MLKNEEKCRDIENQDPNEYDYNYRCQDYSNEMPCQKQQ